MSTDWAPNPVCILDDGTYLFCGRRRGTNEHWTQLYVSAEAAVRHGKGDVCPVCVTAFIERLQKQAMQ